MKSGVILDNVFLNSKKQEKEYLDAFRMIKNSSKFQLFDF